MPKPPVLIFKAFEPGERWITVHPHGKDEKGQPVLIQNQPDGSAKVIGGAGGSLNHLRLTGVKPKSAYKEVIAARAKDRREARKEQRAKDKAAGLVQAKAAAHKKLSEQQSAANRDYIEGVAAAMGWDVADVRFDPSKHAGTAPEVLEKMARSHEMEMLRKANAAVALNRQRLLSDGDARAEADLGQVPLQAAPSAELSVQDLDPISPPGAGLGFSANYGERAEKAGLTEADKEAEAETIKKPLSDNARAAVEKHSALTKAAQANLKLLRESEHPEKLSPKLVEAKKALDLLKLEKKRKMAERKVRAARKEIDQATSEPKAYVLDVDDAKVDTEVADSVASDLRTIKTRAFLNEIEKISPNATAELGRHIGAGAYSSINALALATGGESLVDRSVVDVLGIAGAAQVLARRLQSDLSPAEVSEIADGVEAFHVHHYMEASQTALARAKELQDQVAEIELAAAENGGDLAVMQEINHTRMDAIAETKKVLGQAFGEMEANAALVYALQGGKSDKPFQVSLGKVSVESAIQQVRAIGLQRGDYSIETVAGNRVLTIIPEGMDRLAAPVNRADLVQVRSNLDIIEGKFDEPDWMPLGISDRPDLDMEIKPGVAPQLATPFEPGPDLGASVADYIGGRAADGDAAADIVADLQSAEFVRKVGAGRVDEYMAAINRLAPLKDENGKMLPAESLEPAFDKLADDFVRSKYGPTRTPIQRQNFAVDDKSTEALHRALAAEPSGVAAYKPIGEMTPQDQRALRDFFGAHVAKETPEAAAMRHDLESVEANEPEHRVQDMFGDDVVNPDWSAWRHRRDDLRAKVNAGSLSWSKYVDSMHGQENAYAAVQDLIRSKVSKGFVDSYNRLNPGAPLKLGRTVVRNNLNHLDSVDPAKREARLAQERAMIDGLRERAAGRYASGSVRDKLDAARENQAGMEAAQMGFFAEEPAAAERPLDADERYTVGHEAERRIGAMMGKVGQNFKAGQPVRLFRPNMSDGKNVARQRAVKMIDKNKRVVLSFGTGSGKTLVSLSGFTHLREQGKAKRGLFLVPSIVQGQFGGEALRFLQPGKFKWHAEPGADRDARIAAYKDPTNDFAVMTHQSFRDDMVHLAAKAEGVPEQEMSGRVDAMSRADRKAWMRSLMRSEGINFDYLTVDEGQNTLNRRGKENSNLANVVDSVSDNAGYYVSQSADPIKNDVSEAFSLLQKMDPERYTDQDAFMRKYGVDTVAAKDGLRREMARFQYPSKIDPDITATRTERKVALSEGQHKAISELEKRVSQIRVARMGGKVDVAGMRALSPSSFASVPVEEHEALARDLQKNVGILRDAAVRSIVNGGAKIDDVVNIAKEKSGKPGVVFAHSLDAVEKIGERLKAEGHRVVTITGKDSAKVKAAKRRLFNPDSGDASADILVASDAASTGMNIQRGQWLVNVDTPDTAMTWNQRNGRINRIGQQNDVDLIDLVGDHPSEKRARDRLFKKNALRDMMTTPMETLDDSGLAYFLRQQRDAENNLAA